MIKYFCDLCGKELNPKPYCNNDDPDNYTYGTINIDFNFIEFKIKDVCKGCADKFNKITEDDMMEFIKSKMRGG